MVGIECSIQNEIIDTHGIDFKSLPKRRGNRVAYFSTAVCGITFVLAVTIGVNCREDLYYINKAQKTNVTDCYTKEKKTTFSCLFRASWVLLGVVLSTLVDRVLFVAEEYRHRYERYEGSWRKMIIACFRGIVWRGILCLLFLSLTLNSTLLISHTDTTLFELCDFIYIFGGIGAGPLMHLLNNRTESDVYFSTILEKKGMHVANILAWSYYLNSLKPEAQRFREEEFRFCINQELQSTGDDTEQITTFNKLLLLIPLDYPTIKDLEKIDHHIRKIPFSERSHKRLHYSLYQLLTVDEQPNRCFAIKFIRQPLSTLRSMMLSEVITVSNRRTFAVDVKLFYRALTEILAIDMDGIAHTCLFVPIKTENLESLQNGGLVKCIMTAVNRSCKQGGGIYVPVPRQPREIPLIGRTQNKAQEPTEPEELLQTVQAIDLRVEDVLIQPHKIKHMSHTRKKQDKPPKQIEQKEQLLEKPERANVFGKRLIVPVA